MAATRKITGDECPLPTRTEVLNRLHNTEKRLKEVTDFKIQLIAKDLRCCKSLPLSIHPLPGEDPSIYRYIAQALRNKGWQVETDCCGTLVVQ